MQAAESMREIDGARTANDVAPLLVELQRALRSREFYPSSDPRCTHTHERAYRAWHAELARQGPLELRVDADGFALRGARLARLERRRLVELAIRLTERGVESLRLDRSLEFSDFDALVEMLATDPEEVAKLGGAERMLFCRARQGIELGAADVPAEAALRPPDTDVASPAEAPIEAVAPPAAGSAGTDLAACVNDAERPNEEPGTSEASNPGEDGRGLRALANDPPSPPLPDAASDETRPHETDEPDASLHLATPTGPPDAELVADLRALDGCTDPDRYRSLGAKVCRTVATLDGDERLDEAYRAILVVFSHTRGGEPHPCRELARGLLAEMVRGRRLADVMDRATGPDPAAGLRASQILVELGEEVAAPLLAAIEQQGDADRRAQLFGIAIALGRRMTAEIGRALRDGRGERALVAARLAGDLRDERSVAALAALLEHETRPVRAEAVKALARVGDDEAFEALARALRSPRADVGIAAAYCLGATARPDGIDILGRALDDRRTGRGAIAQEIVRSLGRSGHPEAAAPLGRLIGRRKLFGRRELRELQQKALAALAHVPGTAAEATLRDVAEGRNPRLAQAATRALAARR